MNARITLRAAGRQVGDGWPLSSIETWSSTGSPSRARMTFRDSDPALSTLDIDTEVEIDVNERTIFRGRVAAQRLSIAEATPPASIVELLGGVPVPPSSDSPVMVLVLGETILALDLTLNHSAVHGSVRCEGTALITPGAYVELRRLPGRFERNIAANGVRHSVNDGRWITTIETDHWT